MFLSFDNVLGVHEKALYMLGERSKVLATNIINADTPNYKARDIDFKSVLQQSNSVVTRKVSLEVSDPDHISVVGSGNPYSNLVYRRPLQPSLDGNTVNSQQEIAAYTENAIRYQASLRFLSGKFSGIIRALKGE